MKEVKDYNPSKDPRLIDCKTECGNGKCYAKRYGLFAEKTCTNFVEPKPITNADRIRAMTDEKIEKWFWWMHKEMMRYTDSRVFLHDWLKQEVTNNSTT